EIKNRERNIERDLNHKVSKKIVEEAKQNRLGIKLEYLQRIRNAKSSRNFRYSLNSWSFYQFQWMMNINLYYLEYLLSMLIFIMHHRNVQDVDT
ncbi:MAG: IS200/IS605 family accessory protein TnpB-related protein, partial [Thermoplasmata archaeon]